MKDNVNIAGQPYARCILEPRLVRPAAYGGVTVLYSIENGDGKNPDEGEVLCYVRLDDAPPPAPEGG